MASSEVLVDIRDLYTNFYTYQGVVKALDGINLRINKGETFGLVGETGCGKSVTANSILRLIPSPPGKIEKGIIIFAMPSDKRERMGEMESSLKEIRKGLSESDIKAIQGYFTVHGRGAKEKRKQLLAGMGPNAKEYVKVYSELNEIRRPYDLLKASDKQIRRIRGKYISMIFQEPMSALNPTFTAGDQIAENILLHERKDVAKAAVETIDEKLDELKNYKRAEKIKTDTGELQCSNCKTLVGEKAEACPNCKSSFRPEPLRSLKTISLRSHRRNCAKLAKNPDNTLLKVRSKIPLAHRYEKMIKKEAMRRAKEMLELVRIPDPVNVLTSYPHELSGGMQQRVTIAMALACKPRMLIADEPTTALDVTIQAQILKLMNDLKKDLETSILLITHNLGVVAETCNRVGVMYAGNMAEIASAMEIFKEPLHPYTQGLMNSIPKLTDEISRLEIIEGNVPNLVRPPTGCRFNPRCPFAMGVCRKLKPDLIEVTPGHYVACHLYTEGS